MIAKEVKIECEGSHLTDIDSLEPFQGNLKNLSQENYLKLKKEILELGFSEPIGVWESEGKLKILNGHQRLRTLKQMREENYLIPKIPINKIKAKTLKEAKKKVLALTSQYGEITNEGLFEFMSDAELDMKEIEESFRFPEIDFEDFDRQFNEDHTDRVDRINRGDENAEWAGMPEFKPGDPHIRITFVFKSKEQRDKYLLEKQVKIDKKINESVWIVYV